ncbi:hypothetical protein GOP47_0025476 [Adiantum capillus-veneris]|uniref:glutamate carboxypeptidase II n=1 Tax=Adiantum capillus-veneris TaxID=13818 RepID=A0A9D4U110_ADICA|nr:hypothetical protein GOP47_0025476 [Adiantum capillus-veneris]
MPIALAAVLVGVALQYRCRNPTRGAAERFLDAPGSNATIAHHLFHLTRHPHVAGSAHNLYTTASYVLSAFQQYGLDAHFTDYQVLLSYPLSRSLSISLPNGTSLYTALLQESVDPTQEDHDVIPTFHAYSPSGAVVAEAVYVNYGRPADYDTLRGLGINLTGAIIIARYGKIYRGDIVALAARAGAAAALVYNDPADYADGGKKGFYPEAPWLPPSGVQRGTVFRELGDPLTPGWPSTSYAERLDGSTELPSIPSLPISALDALPILQSLEGPVAPDSWHGALDLPSYRIGRGPALLHFSYSENQTVATIRNVLAVIKGSSEPDRFVLLGNHRDAWTYGAVDPNSGTAALLEVARRLGKLQQEGWKPRRSIYLCNWDAEEYGLIGSTEWVEENEKLLSSKAVAYINVDTAVSGENFSASATPQLDNLLKRIAGKIKDPVGLSGTVFDSWVKAKEATFLIERLGGTGSDYAPFLQHVGVSAIDFTYGGGYPVYHSTYDNYNWMLNFGDPLFHRHVAIVEIWGLIALELAEEEILPFDYGAYATELQVYAESIHHQLETCNCSQAVTVKPLFSAISDMHSAAGFIHHEIKSLRDSTSSREGVIWQRIINDRLVLAERAFVDARGLARGDLYKHLVFGPTTNDDYASSSYPAIQDALFAAKEDAQNSSRWALVQHEIWRAARTATHAALTLRGELT